MHTTLLIIIFLLLLIIQNKKKKRLGGVHWHTCGPKKYVCVCFNIYIISRLSRNLNFKHVLVVIFIKLGTWIGKYVVRVLVKENLGIHY